MSRRDDLETRVSALEAQVGDLTARVRTSQQDAAAARVLAGGADRDVGEIRTEIRDLRQATTSSFNAVREDLTDLRHHVDQGFAEVNRKFTGVDRGFAEVRGRLDAAAGGQEQIVRMLTTLIDRQDDNPT